MSGQRSYFNTLFDAYNKGYKAGQATALEAHVNAFIIHLSPSEFRGLGAVTLTCENCRLQTLIATGSIVVLFNDRIRSEIDKRMLEHTCRP